MNKRTIIAALFAVFSAVGAHGQLAITEVMTSESTTLNGQTGAPSHSDWWEVSNFGANTIDLTGYSWNDDSHGGLLGADPTPFTGVLIHPGEAIVFAQANSVITNADTFRQWWGTNRFSTNVQVIIYPSADPGLGSGGDSVRIWNTNGVAEDEAPEFQVDRVNLGAAIAGRSFLFNTNTGAFDLYSTNGIGGAWKAATADDEGSPGVSPPAGPIFITQQPTNYSTTAGNLATFTISARGLPRPKFQWLFKNVPIAPNAAGISIRYTNGISTLVLTNVQSTNAGAYTVLLNNGFQTVTSSNAVLSVNPAATAPLLTQLPADLTAYVGQTATFSVQATGNPAPAYQWKLNDSVLSGQINPQLAVFLNDTNQTGIYSVTVSNSVASTNVSAFLTVTPKPNLVITEVMSSEAANTNGHADWFEVSNLGSFPVSLRGYRMNDGHALSTAFTITNNATMQPGESVVFVEGMTAQAFRGWWGPELPLTVQIITYDGSGRGLSSTSDEVRIWNAAATDDADRLAGVSFSTAVAGVSFGFDPRQTDQSGFTGISSDGLSTNGVNGAFVAAVGGDIGSPGSIINVPWFTQLTPVSGGYQMTWRSQPNRSYTLQYKNNLTQTNWATLNTLTAGAAQQLLNASDPTISTQRFYRVTLNPGP